jgi:rRNA-processing protein FCF1
MLRVVLDTNALLIPFERSINIDLELKSLLGDCEIFVPGPVIGELKRLKSKHAHAAMALARKYQIYETNVQGDAGVILAAKDLNAYVVTNDFPMQKKLRQAGLTPIFLRSGNHFYMDEY